MTIAAAPEAPAPIRLTVRPRMHDYRKAGRELYARSRLFPSSVASVVLACIVGGFGILNGNTGFATFCFVFAAIIAAASAYYFYAFAIKWPRKVLALDDVLYPATLILSNDRIELIQPKSSSTFEWALLKRYVEVSNAVLLIGVSKWVYMITRHDAGQEYAGVMALIGSKLPKSHSLER